MPTFEVEYRYTLTEWGSVEIEAEDRDEAYELAGQYADLPHEPLDEFWVENITEVG
jgi:hypothetical protein